MKAFVAASWLYGDPAECVDRLRAEHKRAEEAEKRAKEISTRKKSRKIKRLTKAAMARQLKGQK
jgi:hypothetical protein